MCTEWTLLLHVSMAHLHVEERLHGVVSTVLAGLA